MCSGCLKQLVAKVSTRYRDTTEGTDGSSRSRFEVEFGLQMLLAVTCNIFCTPPKSHCFLPRILLHSDSPRNHLPCRPPLHQPRPCCKGMLRLFFRCWSQIFVSAIRVECRSLGTPSKEWTLLSTCYAFERGPTDHYRSAAGLVSILHSRFSFTVHRFSGLSRLGFPTASCKQCCEQLPQLQWKYHSSVLEKQDL